MLHLIYGDDEFRANGWASGSGAHFCIGCLVDEQGTQLREQSAADFDAYMKAEIAKYAKLVKDAGVRLE